MDVVGFVHQLDLVGQLQHDLDFFVQGQPGDDLGDVAVKETHKDAEVIVLTPAFEVDMGSVGPVDDVVEDSEVTSLEAKVELLLILHDLQREEARIVE